MRSWNEIRKAATAFSKRGKNPLVATAYMQSSSVLGWLRRKDNRDHWLHSDMKDVAYFFNFKFYDKAIEKGNLK